METILIIIFIVVLLEEVICVIIYVCLYVMFNRPIIVTNNNWLTKIKKSTPVGVAPAVPSYLAFDPFVHEAGWLTENRDMGSGTERNTAGLDYGLILLNSPTLLSAIAQYGLRLCKMQTMIRISSLHSQWQRLSLTAPRVQTLGG